LYLAFYKPKGVISTCDDSVSNNIISFIEQKARESDSAILDEILSTRIYPIGRLDKNSEGLMILTNDGKLTNLLTHPKYQHEKEYIVRCQKPISKNFINKFSSGVEIEINDKDQNIKIAHTKPCKTVQLSDHEFQTILQQGYNRQIRKMVEKLGNKVTKLKRIRIASVSIQDNLINPYPANIITVLRLKEGAFKKLKYSVRLFKNYDGS
jgi:23S rRNA pseudouridine2604 synthase